MNTEWSSLHVAHIPTVSEGKHLTDVPRSLTHVTVKDFIHEQENFEGDVFLNRKPVEVILHMCVMIKFH